MTDLWTLPVTETFTVATADSVTRFASGVGVTDRGRKWKFTLSGDGKSILLVNVPQATVLFVR